MLLRPNKAKFGDERVRTGIACLLSRTVLVCFFWACLQVGWQDLPSVVLKQFEGCPGVLGQPLRAVASGGAVLPGAARQSSSQLATSTSLPAVAGVSQRIELFRRLRGPEDRRYHCVRWTATACRHSPRISCLFSSRLQACSQRCGSAHRVTTRSCRFLCGSHVLSLLGS